MAANIHRLGPISLGILMLIELLSAQSASAQTHLAALDSQPSLGTVTVQSEPSRISLTTPAPERSSPQTYLSPQAISEIATPLADFGTLANLTPSFVSSAPNGPGFDAAKNMSLRGFSDGQFNITMDGIPFADPDSLGHHSTSYFPAANIDHLMVDRSPGSATTLGYSTLGGSLNLYSVELPAMDEKRIYGAYGSFNTSLVGARLATARPAESGQSGWLLNLEHMESNGAMAFSSAHKDNLLVKSETRWDGKQLNLLYAYDSYHFINPPSVTSAQVAANGSGAGFNNTPGTAGYYGYNLTDRNSDFGYARLHMPLDAGWELTETVYTYAYNNRGLSPNGDLTKSNIGSGFGVPGTDIGGRISSDSFRTLGNILQAQRSDAQGTLRAGLWIDQSRQTYNRNALDLSTGQPYNANANAASPVLFDFKSTLGVIQPYVEYEWKPTEQWNIRPGLRYQQVRRSFDAQVVPNSLPGTHGPVERRVSTSLPSLDARYRFNPLTQAYVQWSNGALVPSQSFFYTKTPTQSNQASPQNSRAFQVGVTRGDSEASLTLDAYAIHINNYIAAVTQNNVTQYINAGKVQYKGLELEGQRQLGAGFSALANASVIRAQFQDSGVTSAAQKAGDDIPLAPRYIGLLGVLYQSGPWSASLLTKFVGAQYQGKNGSSDGPNYRVAGYNYTHLTVSRIFGELGALKDSRLSLQINNLRNATPVTDAAGLAASGSPLVNVLAKRSAMLAFSAGF
jgi:iron complex outermembrane receptor protein